MFWEHNFKIILISMKMPDFKEWKSSLAGDFDPSADLRQKEDVEIVIR